MLHHLFTRYAMLVGDDECVYASLDGPWVKYEDVAPLIKAVKAYRDTLRAWESAVLTSADLRHTEYVKARDALFALVGEES